MAAASTGHTPERRGRRRLARLGGAWRRRFAMDAVDRAQAPAGVQRAARRLGHYAWAERWRLGGAVAFFLASSAVDPVLPALFKWLIDHGFHAGMGVPLWMVPVAIIGLFVIRGVLGFAGTALFARTTSDVILRMRSELADAVLRADASLFTHLGPGAAAARVINDPQNAVNALGGALTTLLRDGTTLLALISYLLWLDWKLTLVSLLTVPLLALVMRRVQKRVLAISGQSWESQMRLIGIVDDIARAWRVVRTFDAGEFERRRFEGEATRLRGATLHSMVVGAMMTPLTQLVASSGVALIVTLALVNARQAGATVGDFVAFVTTLLMTISPMRHLTDVSQPVIGGLVQARACFDLMDTPAEPDTGEREVDHPRGAIRFEAVGVRYTSSEQDALNDIDLDVRPGQTVAFVGPSGAGKSTLVNTLLGFTAPCRGRVLIDDTDIAELRKSALRRQFAVVSQDIVLFDGSIEDNVVYALPRDAARVEDCLRAADLWPFVCSLPGGVNSAVGTNATRLSGGQRQRLAIARALYKEAAVWVLDEATSALDSASEQAVQGAIERWRGERTLVLVAHRLSTVRHADRIHVLDQGRVVESGSHDELVAQRGLYAAMVHAQRLS